jgi:CRISPR-associated endoribonuclease Cas6
MRILIELQSTQNSPYEMEYHCHLQGFIYNLLSGSVYDVLHDEKGSKYFAFSNIFPFDNIRQGDIRTLIVSSPDERFIKYLFDILQLLAQRGTQINVGYMTFKINYIEELYPHLPNSGNLITGTPITIRIPKSMYKQYGYESVYENFTYWRNEQPIDVFIEQLQIKLLSKYAKYHTESFKEYHEFLAAHKDIKLFDTFKFKKQVSTKVYMDSIEQVIIGSLWEIGFNSSDKDLIQFALDAGLGERNSLGFGFMNLMTQNHVYK